VRQHRAYLPAGYSQDGQLKNGIIVIEESPRGIPVGLRPLLFELSHIGNTRHVIVKYYSPKKRLHFQHSNSTTKRIFSSIIESNCRVTRSIEISSFREVLAGNFSGIQSQAALCA